MPNTFNLNRLHYFVAVVEEGSMTAASARLQVSKAVISKQIQQLEAELGAMLLVRNTRHLSPTETGLALYEQGKAAVEQANAAFRQARDGNDVPRGTLRVTATLDYGTLHLAPLIARYIHEYPETRIELHLDDSRIDLVEKRFDVGFRIGWLEDSSNLARKVGHFEEWVVGSPGIDAHTIRHPKDLTSVSVIENASLKQPSSLTFSREGESVAIHIDRATSMNSSMAICQVVENGHCLAVLPDYLVHQSVAAGAMQRLLPDWSLRSGGIHAVTPPSRFRPLITRRFIEMVVDYHRNTFGK